MKKTITTLLTGLMFALIIMLPMVNVAAASTNKSAPVNYNSYTTHQATATPTVMALALSTSNGSQTNLSLTVKVNEKFAVIGAIGAGTSTKSADPISGASINILVSADQQKWASLGNFTSGTGQNGGLPKGVFGAGVTAPSSPGVYYLMAVFAGDGQYALSLSNVVTLTVTQ